MCLDNFHIDFCLYFVNLQHFDSVNEVHTTVCYLAVPPPKKKKYKGHHSLHIFGGGGKTWCGTKICVLDYYV